MKEQLDHYAENGYLVVEGALSADEVDEMNAAIDEDLAKYPRLWRRGNYPGKSNNQILLAHPEFDITMRPIRLLPLIDEIMGPDACADQHGVIVRPPNPDGATECRWHRDGRRETDAPYYTYILHIIFYLTQVTNHTHCFSVIPGSAKDQTFPPAASYNVEAAVHITGPPGTAILANGAIVHALNFRKTKQERRTVHCHIGRTTQPSMANYTIFPRRLWAGQDAQTKHYYSRLNSLTKLVLDRF